MQRKRSDSDARTLGPTTCLTNSRCNKDGLSQWLEAPHSSACSRDKFCLAAPLLHTSDSLSAYDGSLSSQSWPLGINIGRRGDYNLTSLPSQAHLRDSVRPQEAVERAHLVDRHPARAIPSRRPAAQLTPSSPWIQPPCRPLRLLCPSQSRQLPLTARLM